jgi:hypothetical protein
MEWNKLKKKTKVIKCINKQINEIKNTILQNTQKYMEVTEKNIRN